MTRGSLAGTDSSWGGVRHVEAHRTLSLPQTSWGKTRNRRQTLAKEAEKTASTGRKRKDPVEPLAFLDLAGNFLPVSHLETAIHR